MKKIFLLLSLLGVFVSSCVNSEPDLTKFSEVDLVGEWFMDMGGGESVVYNIHNDATLTKTIVTPFGEYDTYQEGYYTMENEYLSVFVEEYNGVNSNFESRQDHNWEIVAINNTQLSIKENGFTKQHIKIFGEFTIDKSLNQQVLLSSVFEGKMIVKAYSIDESIAQIKSNKIYGISSGITFVCVEMDDHSQYILRVRVLTDELSDLITFYKALNIPFQMIPDYLGIYNDYVEEESLHAKAYLYEVHDCVVRIGTKYASDVLVNDVLIDLSTSITSSMVIEYLDSHFEISDKKEDMHFYSIFGTSIFLAYKSSIHKMEIINY